MTNKLSTTGRWWMLWLTVGVLIFSIGECSGQDTVRWQKTWVRDIGQDSVEFIETTWIRNGRLTDIDSTTTYEKFERAFRNDTISVQNYKANQSLLQKHMEYVRNNPPEIPIYKSEIKDYIEYCYNDSSIATYIGTPPNIIDSSVVIPSYYGYTIQQWQHKEPTFKGFYEYLNKLK